MFESFGGAFSTYAVVEAQLPLSSTAVALGSPVEYRNVTVGSVASEGRSVPGGLVLVTLHLDVSKLNLIPSGVRATETPVSFFGDAYIVLEPPAQIGNATLKAGATIPALTVGQTASLQATLGDLDNLLTELHPGELDAALTAFAGALQGQGTSLGTNLVKGNNYFQQMLPLWPTVVSNLKTLVPVANQFASATPDILSILSNQTTTGETIDAQAAEVRNAIGGGATLAKETSQLLTAIQQPYSFLPPTPPHSFRTSHRTRPRSPSFYKDSTRGRVHGRPQNLPGLTWTSRPTWWWQTPRTWGLRYWAGPRWRATWRGASAPGT